jgi:hypothetical protein
VRADAARPYGPQQRVDERVGDRVTVGVAGQTGVSLDGHAAQDERPVSIEAVAIVAEADPHDRVRPLRFE